MFGDDMFREMMRMQREMDRLFSRAYGDVPALGYGESLPVRKAQCDLCETENGYMASFELPGVDKKDIDLNVDESGITVQVEKSEEKSDKDQHSYSSYSFYRHLPLPAGADASKAKASYKNGMLRVEMPKSEVEHKRKLEIE